LLKNHSLIYTVDEILDLDRSNSPRDTFAWKRGETTATAGQLMAFNGITAEAICKQGMELIK
jgi:hypothetical protein